MVDKKSLRREFKEIRRLMDRNVRSKADRSVAERFLASEEYIRCKRLLCYVSTGIEVDTFSVLLAAWQDGKLVYAPRCAAGDNRMDFYRLNSLGELVNGLYGIPEPAGDEMYDPEHEALCVVPALSCDMSCHRLGFGMGFYDRFISENANIYAVGFCYDSCIMEKLPAEPHDKTVSKVFTESRIITIDV